MKNRTRTPLLTLALLSTFALGACGGEAPDASAEGGATMSGEDEEALVQRAREIHDRVITLDTHVDISTSNFTADRNYTTDLPNTQVDLPSMEEGGLDVAWLVVYTGQGPLTEEGYAAAYENADAKFEAIHRLAEEIAPERIDIATSSDEVRQIVADGKKVAMIGIENGYPIGTDVTRVQEFYDRGGRYMSLAHNGHSQLSDSNTGERDGEWLHGDGVTTGLSELGREVVAEMNRVGMMIDVSHPSKGAFMEMAELTEAPMIASHSSARALNDHSRNLDDEQLRILAEGGGVVQTVAFRSYIDQEKRAARREMIDSVRTEIADEMGFEPLGRQARMELSEAERTQYEARMGELEDALAAEMEAIDEAAPPVDVADFVDHVDYLVDLIGIDHVGISSDFDGGGGVEGWDDASETFNVTLEMVRRGYTEEEISKIWSGNLLRALDETQAVAERIQAGG